MKRRLLVTATVLAAFSLAPVAAAACDEYDDSMASVKTPAQLASAPAAAASKVPAATVAKTSASKATKQAAAKPAPASSAKVAAVGGE